LGGNFVRETNIPATLTATDNATTPPSITATLAGTGGASVAVYVALWQPNGQLFWQLAGSRTGDGSLTVTTVSGWQLVYAVVGGNTITAVVPVTATQQGGYYVVRTAVRNAIEKVIGLLNLPIRGGIIQQWKPNESMIKLPAILLTHDETKDTRTPVIVGMSDIGYAIAVWIVDRISWQDNNRLPKWDLIRQKITRAFDNQRLPGVPTALICTIEDGPFNQSGYDKYSFMTGIVTIRVKSREPYGIGV
jgi:hypothetical protein